MDVSQVIEELGGHPRSDESENLQLLANEVIILRDKLGKAEDAEGRCERRLGNEIDARSAAERRATVAEGIIAGIDEAIARGKQEALAAGVPLRLPDKTDDRALASAS